MRLHEVISAALAQQERTPDEPVLVAAAIEDGAIQPRTRCVIVVVGPVAAAALAGMVDDARTQRWRFTTATTSQVVGWVYSTDMTRIRNAVIDACRREVHFRWIDRKRDTRRPVMCVDLPPITMLRPRSAAPDLPAEEGQRQP